MKKRVTSLLIMVLMIGILLSVLAFSASAEEEPDYLCLTSAGSTTIGFDNSVFPTARDYKLEYSKNGGDWTQAFGTTTIPLSDGESVRFRANGKAGMFSAINVVRYLKFKMSGDGTVAASGNVMSLLESDDECCNSCFYSLFEDCRALTTAPKLPATTLAGWCYDSMFSGCASLTAAPELPATAMAESCYGSMFDGCASLTAAPELPATALARGCYGSMFSGCASLTTAPELPATTLAQGCYGRMFKNCTSLTVTTDIPEDWHYHTLFIPDVGCCWDMFSGVPNEPALKSGATYFIPHITDGVCLICNTHCPHKTWENSECVECHKKCTQHDWNGGVCSICHIPCDHDWDSATGICNICQYHCSHDGNTCALCGKQLHSLGNGAIASALSKGSLAVIVGVATAVIFGLGGFFLGRKKKRPAFSGGENE
ncbi:MAG: hypothetical protein MJ101_04780 [Clostridia bacterium]|nr:hypothetical protein [Clostridia bacterium]